MPLSNFGSMEESAGSTMMPQMKRRAEFGRMKFDRIDCIFDRSAADASDRCWSKRLEYGFVDSPGARCGVAGFA